MSCCGNRKSTNDIYVPLSVRLVEFAKQTIDANDIPAKMYIFSFVDNENNCIECQNKFSVMLNWFDQRNILTNPALGVKWIFEDDMQNNHISHDIGLTRSPTHIITDNVGRIIDIVAGFPDSDWLDTHFMHLLGKVI